MCSSPTSNLHTTIRSRCHRFSSQRGPYGQASAPPSHAIRAQQLLQEIPPVPRHSRPPLDSSSTTRSGEEHETPIGSRSRWRHRGDVRDALDGSRWTVLGAGNEPPAFMPRDIWCYWAGTPNQHRQTKRLYRRMRIGPAQRELSRNNGERFLAHGYGSVPRAERLSRYSTTVLLNGAHVRYKGDDGLWWLGTISASKTTKGVYLLLFLDDPGSIKLPLPPARYTTSAGAVRGSWCLQAHLARAFARWVQHNVGESRGPAIDK